MTCIDHQARAERLVRIETVVDAGQPSYEVRLVVGVQSFKINFVHDSLEEAEWMKKRLVKALVRVLRDAERVVWREAITHCEELNATRQLYRDKLSPEMRECTDIRTEETECLAAWLRQRARETAL
jgi:hypothetical protein